MKRWRLIDAKVKSPIFDRKFDAGERISWISPDARRPGLEAERANVFRCLSTVKQLTVLWPDSRDAPRQNRR